MSENFEKNFVLEEKELNEVSGGAGANAFSTRPMFGALADEELGKIAGGAEASGEMTEGSGFKKGEIVWYDDGASKPWHLKAEILKVLSETKFELHVNWDDGCPTSYYVTDSIEFIRHLWEVNY